MVVVDDSERLQKYLDTLRNSKDEKLREFGVYDNYTILLNGNFEQLTEDLERRNMLKFRSEARSSRKELGVFLFDYGFFEYNINHPMIEKFFDYYNDVIVGVTNQILLPDVRLHKSEFDIILREFNITTILHPSFNATKIDDVPLKWCRPIANAIIAMCDYALEKRIPLCLPKTTESSSRDSEKIIYYKP